LSDSASLMSFVIPLGFLLEIPLSSLATHPSRRLMLLLWDTHVTRVLKTCKIMTGDIDG
jgi:hypothetical protein